VPKSVRVFYYPQIRIQSYRTRTGKYTKRKQLETLGDVVRHLNFACARFVSNVFILKDKVLKLLRSNDVSHY
jgi:uncharacterized protein YutD